MRQSKLVVALIVLCAVLAPISLPRLANSQFLTTLSVTQQFTSTPVLAVTSTVTSTEVTPQGVQYDLTPSDFNNRTDTFMLGYSEIGTAPYYPQNSLCLMYDYFLLNATTAYEYRIHFDTQQGIPIHFLILNMDQLKQFNHTNCAQGSFGWELRVVAPASDLVWVVPQHGEYALLFLSRQFVGGYVHLSVQAYGQAIQTSTSAYTTSSIMEWVSTQLMASTLPTTAPTTTSSTGSIFVAAVIIVGLVILGAAITLRTRRSTVNT